MRILITPDKFKGSLTSFRVCEAIAKGLARSLPDAEIIQLPLSDGGEGMLDAIALYTAAKTLTAEVSDPLFRKISAPWLISGDRRTAFIEMAKASGLQLLKRTEYDPLRSSTFGTGQLIAEAIRSGAREIVIGIGGSATNDGGIGMAAALGVRFLDKDEKELSPVGGNLIQIARIDLSQRSDLQGLRFRIAGDVSNPLCGPLGATLVYAQQKGATPEIVRSLEAGMKHYANVLERDLGINVAGCPGAGAAGGLGAGCMAFLGAGMEKGVDLIIEYSGAERQARDSDLIITGEGKMDEQTLQGKLVAGIAALGQKYHKPVLAICGTLGLSAHKLEKLGVAAAFPIMTATMTLDHAMQHAEDLLVETSFQLGSILNTFRAKSGGDYGSSGS